MNTTYIRKYWKEVISRSFKAAWKKTGMRAATIAVFVILISVAIIGLSILMGIFPNKIFSDQSKNVERGLLTFCGSTIILFIFFLAMIYRTPPEMNYKKEQEIKKLQKKFKEPPEIKKLAILRTEGVALRNTGEGLKDISAIPEWVENYKEWDKRVIDTLSKLSEGKAEWLRTLNRMPVRKFPYLNDDHALYLNVFEEKLKRLESLLGMYLDLPGH